MLSEKWTKSVRSSRNVMFAALVVIGAIAVYNRVVAPHKNYLLAARRYGLVAGNLAKKNQVVTGNVAAKEKQLEKLQGKFGQIHTRLFGPIGARKFFGQLQTVSEEANCIMYSLKFLPTDQAINAEHLKAGSHITANRAVLSVIGNYGDIVVLVNKLQDRLEQVRIDSVNVKLIRKNAEQLKCNMTITIYVMQNEEEPPYD